MCKDTAQKWEIECQVDTGTSVNILGFKEAFSIFKGKNTELKSWTEIIQWKDHNTVKDTINYL